MDAPPIEQVHKAEQPNIVLIFIDDMGYGDLGCYGSTKNSTPHLDQMAKEGMRFTDFYVASPVCSPSRAALMTGCYPRRVGLESGTDFTVLMPEDPAGLNPDEITVAEILKGEGYTTSLIGKWHLGDQLPFMPTNHGFDYFFGLPYSNDHYSDRVYAKHLPKRFENGFNPLPLMRNNEVLEKDPDQSTLTARYTEEAVQFIEQNKDRPFFLLMSHMYVHTPLFPAPEFRAKSKNGAYGAEVEQIDHSTGVILDTLKKLGLDNNTLVVFTSDNGSRGGGGSNKPLRGKKGETWEGGMREPCIMRWPGKIPAGSTCSELSTAMDFLPTFATLAGGSAPTDRIIDGHDICDLMTGVPNATTPYEAFFYYNTNHRLEAVRSGKWKLHLNQSELYDLDADIGEKTNLFGENPDVIKKLNQLVDKIDGDLGTKAPGKNCRPAGHVDHPVPLTTRD